MNKINFDALDIPLYAEYLSTNTSLSEKSIKTYRGSMVNFFKKNPDLNNPHHYNDFLIRVMGKSKKRGDMNYYALRHFINYKIINNLALKNEIESILIKPQVRDPKNKKDYLDDEQRLTILNNMSNPTHKIIALIMFETGLRIGDVLRLRQKDINIDEKDKTKCLRINVTAKGQKYRTVYIFDTTAINIINQFIESQEHFNTNINILKNNIAGNTMYLFMHHMSINKKKNQLHKSEDELISYYYEKFRRDLIMSKNSNGLRDKNFSTHDFRRCFARDVYRKFTNDIITLQRALGHRRIETTSRYLRYSGEQEIDIFKSMQT